MTILRGLLPSSEVVVGEPDEVGEKGDRGVSGHAAVERVEPGHGRAQDGFDGVVGDRPVAFRGFVGQIDVARFLGGGGWGVGGDDRGREDGAECWSHGEPSGVEDLMSRGWGGKLMIRWSLARVQVGPPCENSESTGFTDYYYRGAA